MVKKIIENKLNMGKDNKWVHKLKVKDMFTKKDLPNLKSQNNYSNTRSF